MEGDSDHTKKAGGDRSGLSEFDDEALFKAIEEASSAVCSGNVRLISEADRRDLAQRVYLRLRKNDGEKLRSFNRRSLLATWLNRIALNEARTMNRDKRRWQSIDESAFDLYSSGPEQEAKLLIQERRKIYLWVGSRLSESQRLILDRCERDDFDASAAARELGISTAVLYDRKREAIRRARKLLREYEKDKTKARREK